MQTGSEFLSLTRFLLEHDFETINQSQTSGVLDQASQGVLQTSEFLQWAISQNVALEGQATNETKICFTKFLGSTLS